MMYFHKYKMVFSVLLCLAVCSNCQPKKNKELPATPVKGTFGYDAAFLSKHRETIVLENGDARLAVCPAYQGRVMTSSSGGDTGLSYGWLNYKLIESGENQSHINPVGGEDRFWLGPEGGQFSIFFKPGSRFVFEDWQTPAVLDTEPFEVVSKGDKEVVFEKDFEIGNYSGTVFNVNVNRKIRLLSMKEVAGELALDLPESVNMVAYQSENTITNTGQNTWSKETGALSIWILGMFNPSPDTKIIIPFVTGEEAELGPVVNDTYFGKVPEDRLIIGDGVLFFSGDGKYRSKIGLNPKRALPIMGSYDSKNQVLTLVHFSKPDDVTDYVNSMWEIQEAPFAGDAANSYNDGPVDGKALGPFYELESSSPAAFLKPQKSMTHTHTTLHLKGTEEELEPIIQKVLHTNLKDVNAVL